MELESEFNLDNNAKGEGIVPLSGVIASTPNAPILSVSTLSDSQIDIRFSKPETWTS